MQAARDSDEWERVVAGDGDAFGRIWDQHSPRIERHVAGLVDRPADIDDAVAVVFLHAWRKRQSVRIVNGSVLPWLLVTATQVAHNVRRSSQRYAALLARLPIAEPGPDPSESTVDGDAGLALRRLSLTDQEILTLCVLEEYSEREAAEALNIRPGTVKSRLHRARAHLSLQFQAISNVAHHPEGSTP